MDVLAALEFDWSQLLVPFSSTWKQETACSVLVGVACGVLGCFVVLRRMALIGDALSHAILPGVVLAFLVTQSTDISKLFLGALLAGGAFCCGGPARRLLDGFGAALRAALLVSFAAFFPLFLLNVRGPSWPPRGAIPRLGQD